MKNIGLFVVALFISASAFAQTLEEELGFIYVKADYLLETNRYEDAIAEFTKIITQDPGYKDALYKRATAKYALAAYKGVIKDVLQSFEYVGITPESVLLLGEAQESAGDAAAENTMTTAAVLYPDHRKTRKYRKKTDVPTRPERRQENTDEEGDEKKLEEKISAILSDLMPKDKEDDTRQGDGDDRGGSNEGNDDATVDTTPEEEVDVYVPDNSINEIYIDEDLTLLIKNGLGNRRVLEQPNILILSETSGDVAVDICVNRNGKVTSAEFNPGMSTLNTQSLISLAVRKSNEFWFDAANRDETCGTIVFSITGRT